MNRNKGILIATLVLITLFLVYLIAGSFILPNQSTKPKALQKEKREPEQTQEKEQVQENTPDVQTPDDANKDQEKKKRTENVIEKKEIDFKVIRKKDPKLMEGTENVVQVGKKGERTITKLVTYENDKKVKEEVIDDYVSVEPVDQIVHVGSKDATTKQESVLEEIDYKTLYKDDPSLAMGETKVIQEGVRGLKRVTYEVVYSGSQEKSRTIIEQTIEQEPIDQIIAQGTKEDLEYERSSKSFTNNQDALNWAIEQNADPSSPYYEKPYRIIYDTNSVDVDTFYVEFAK